MCARKNYATLEIHPYRNRAEITLLMCELFVITVWFCASARAICYNVDMMMILIVTMVVFYPQYA